MTDEVTQAPTITEPFDAEKRVDQYVKVRDMKKEMAERHKLEMAPLAECLEQLEVVMLAGMNAINADNLKTKAGTVYKSVRESASVADMAAFWSYVVATGNFDLLDKKANVTAVKVHIEDPNNAGAAPPGVNFSTITTVNVRRK